MVDCPELAPHVACAFPRVITLLPCLHENSAGVGLKVA